ncbi:hypothetical protein OG723_44030 (plasmid) [Streptomyces sp. NBC_01278]|uniref:hypothetical protein n=1 Tax=Streptomyces sp. NBC_01278 TaxID=2903809 RepID=UPI002E33CFD2|nr:hypothetical protein [Streptomyces sp. NBC_01278]
MSNWADDTDYDELWYGDEPPISPPAISPSPGADFVSVTPESIRRHDRILLGGLECTVVDMLNPRSRDGKVLILRGRPPFFMNGRFDAWRPWPTISPQSRPYG